MTSPAKYVHACRQAQKNGPDALSPNVRIEAVESNPIANSKEPVMSKPTSHIEGVATSDTLTPNRYAPETVALAKRIIAEHEAAEHAAEARA